MPENSGAGSFQVRPGELERLADELAAQRDAVRHPADRLAALGADPLEPGGFAEAYALREAHTAAALRMHQLAFAVAMAVDFAEEVTRAMAAGYRAADESIADSYRALYAAPAREG
ncbi:hypothetical protein Asp14428_12970 [Actinoplanes sp. NBRC 14428]|nr:hypothetical protein Asp14428_12970 [Actinoplanes sp. NBRC 14428]